MPCSIKTPGGFRGGEEGAECSPVSHRTQDSVQPGFQRAAALHPLWKRLVAAVSCTNPLRCHWSPRDVSHPAGDLERSEEKEGLAKCVGSTVPELGALHCWPCEGSRGRAFQLDVLSSQKGENKTTTKVFFILRPSV